jgi:hypothetical protein
MRTFALVLLAAAACGGGSASPPPRAPEPAPAAPAPESGTTIQVNTKRPAEAAPRAEAKVAEEPAPAPPPPPPSALATLDRVHDKAGEIPGMAGWTVKRVEDKTRCGANRIVITKSKVKLDADQTALAKLYTLAFPTDLNFDPNNKKTVEASMKKFDAFVTKLKTTGESSSKQLEAQLTSADPTVKAGAAARLAQLSLQMASILARAPIPKDVRSGELAEEKIDAYCDKMEEVAEPLVMRGREAIAACAKYGAPDGWYSALCATAPE